MFLGVGDCVTLLEVAQLNAEEQRRSGEAHIPLSLTAVPLYSSPALSKPCIVGALSACRKETACIWTHNTSGTS